MKSAIAWEVLLRSGEATATERAHFDRWRQASAANESAWQSLQRKLSPFRQLADGDAHASRDALLHADLPRRRALKAGLKSTLGLAMLGTFGYRAVHTLGYDATFRTGIGEQRTVALGPDTSVRLDAGSSLYRVGAPAGGAWRLDAGCVLVDAALRADDATLVTATTHGSFALRHGRYSLGVYDDHSLLAVAQGEGTLALADGSRQLLRAGQTLRFTGQRLREARESVAMALAWTGAMLMVSDQAVGDVLSVLRRYRAGVIRASEAAARRRVSGVFNLRDPDGVLRQLAEALPLHIERYGDYLVLIGEA